VLDTAHCLKYIWYTRTKPRYFVYMKYNSENGFHRHINTPVVSNILICFHEVSWNASSIVFVVSKEGKQQTYFGRMLQITHLFVPTKCLSHTPSARELLFHVKLDGMKGKKMNRFIAESKQRLLRSMYIWLTLLSRVLLEELMVAQLVKNFPSFYRTRKSVTGLQRACHLPLA
jgi:hypothetical protein